MLRYFGVILRKVVWLLACHTIRNPQVDQLMNINNIPAPIQVPRFPCSFLTLVSVPWLPHIATLLFACQPPPPPPPPPLSLQAEYKRLLHTSVAQRLDSKRLLDSRIFSNELVKVP
jgi:hypothetical protein